METLLDILMDCTPEVRERFNKFLKESPKVICWLEEDGTEQIRFEGINHRDPLPFQSATLVNVND